MTNSPCSRALHYFLYLFIFDKSLKKDFPQYVYLCVFQGSLSLRKLFHIGCNYKGSPQWESSCVYGDSFSLQKLCYNGCTYKVSPQYESWDCISKFLSCESFVAMVIHIRFLPSMSPYMYSKFPKTMQCFIQNHLKLCHNSNIYVASHLCFLMWCLKSLFPRKPHHNGCIDMASP